MAKGKNQHVVTHNGAWAVRSENSKRVTKEFDTKAEATEYGRGIARNQQSELVIHGRNGQIQDKDSFGNDDCPPADKKH
jgi:hypothetical protein